MSLIEEKTLADHDINVRSIRQELQLLEEQLKKHNRNEIHPSLTATDPDTVSRQAEPHWIPCSERLPEEYGNYLATMDDGDVQECTYSPEKNTPFMRGGWSTCEADGIVFLDIAEVTAWQPLPEPYREGAQE